MELNPLNAISPVDGRYRRDAAPLARYFSEGALIRYRALVEVEYFIALSKLSLPQLKGVDKKTREPLRDIYRNFSEADAEAVKRIEKQTNHDVKAVEYFLKDRFDALGLSEHKEFIHFGLTSQDINNTAMPCALKDAWIDLMRPALVDLTAALEGLARQWKNVVMLARTHGQPASPTTLGKELYVFVERIKTQAAQVDRIPFSAKFGGAVGNFNAHRAAYPAIDWPAFADGLVNDVLGLLRTRVTTQIEPYDNLAAFCDGMRRVGVILIDLCRDIWTYIAMDYFKQRIKDGEVGSSTMPHKINPIDFENAEGNIGVANALFGHLSEKLPISRLQRDLTDSTVTRNIGVPMGHLLIAFKSLTRGMEKLILNGEKIAADLEANWAVVAEGIQTILRREGYPKPYEALKDLTRTHGAIDAAAIQAFIDGLDVAESVKTELRGLSPHIYVGIIDF